MLIYKELIQINKEKTKTIREKVAKKKNTPFMEGTKMTSRHMSVCYITSYQKKEANLNNFSTTRMTNIKNTDTLICC